MGLSAFEIAVGGISSIPVLGVLIFLIYKAFGEKNLDTSKLKPKKAASAGASWDHISTCFRMLHCAPPPPSAVFHCFFIKKQRYVQKIIVFKDMSWRFIDQEIHHAFRYFPQTCFWWTLPYKMAKSFKIIINFTAAVTQLISSWGFKVPSRL